jgi:hypothetical protein
VVTNVSEGRTVSIFRVEVCKVTTLLGHLDRLRESCPLRTVGWGGGELNMAATYFSQMFVSTCKTTRRHSPEDHNMKNPDLGMRELALACVYTAMSGNWALRMGCGYKWVRIMSSCRLSY